MVLSMERWVGKVAVVTGASSGIGAAIAEKLVKEGLQVAGLARRKERVEELAKTLSGAKGNLFAIKTDLSKEEDILNAFKWIKDNLGPVHILINNAGTFTPENLTDGSTKTWKNVLDVNVLALGIATREAIKDMKANKVDGHIIHINSILGHQVFNNRYNMYPASKFAVRALAETLRLELNSQKSKIKISDISPGLIDTEIISPQFKERRGEFYKEGRIIEPGNIADGVVYVLSTPPHVQIQELMIRPVRDI